MIAKIKRWLLHRTLDRLLGDLPKAPSRDHKMIIAHKIDRVVIQLKNL